MVGGWKLKGLIKEDFRKNNDDDEDDNKKNSWVIGYRL